VDQERKEKLEKDEFFKGKIQEMEN